MTGKAPENDLQGALWLLLILGACMYMFVCVCAHV